MTRTLEWSTQVDSFDRVSDTYQSLSVCEVYPELAHGADDGQEALHCVGVDDGPVVLALLRAVTRLVDYLHLFHDRRLAALARA